MADTFDDWLEEWHARDTTVSRFVPEVEVQRLVDEIERLRTEDDELDLLAFYAERAMEREGIWWLNCDLAMPAATNLRERERQDKIWRTAVDRGRIAHHAMSEPTDA